MNYNHRGQNKTLQTYKGIEERKYIRVDQNKISA